MSDATCSVNDCGRTAIKRGWCNGHYKRWWRHGDPLAGRREHPTTCAIDDCEELARSRDWCNVHYQRWRQYGDPTATAWRSRTIAERLDALTEKCDPCWFWRGAKSRMGYGRFRLGNRTVQAHRVAYENAVGPIPPGLEIDHLCRNRACVNPSHLEPVTHEENLRRARESA